MIRLSALVLAAAMLAACGGGGTGTTPSTPTQSHTAQGAQALGITFAGTQTLNKLRGTRDLNSVPVTVSVNGTVVGNGTLDSGGHAKIAFTVPVAPGSTITVTAGQLTVVATLALTSQSTAVLVTVKADGSITVSSSADPAGAGVVNPNDPEHEDTDEDGHGNVTSITASGSVLPANAPFSFVNGCGTITLTPTSSAVARIKFEEKGSDDESDDAGRFKFEGAFTAALHFPVISSAARVHIEIFDAQGKRLIEVKAPISAFTSGTNANASPCPSATAAPSTSPKPTPEPSESPSGAPSPSASPSPNH
ncbi:MAG: hypothetical protein JWO85_1040 [Candidatus Eremiobacteraeota bacterium]|jgi:hypothetical protein|nr:hypothetical protein [Candidatus Eremiobacteraeota bacterium]